MSQDETKRIGILVGREQDWPDAFLEMANEYDDVVADLAQLGGTFMDEDCPYHLIVDRVSHEIPYYRSYLKYAALNGAYIINNPFTWSADSKFSGVVLVNNLGFTSPRTVVLPNKEVEEENNTGSFRNLIYPMDWKGIIDYVGVPAIFKDVSTGGRRIVYRVHSVDELIRRYDESGTRTMILQQIIESQSHIHAFVIGQEDALLLRYSLANGRYLSDPVDAGDNAGKQMKIAALALTRAYGYDINMVEFVMKDGEPNVINSTNPAPVMDKALMTNDQFAWCVEKTAKIAVKRARQPLPQKATFNLQ